MQYATFKTYQTFLFDIAQKNNLHTYAIVDSLRANGTPEEMVFSNLDYVDLWDRRLTRNEQEVPLYLVKLERDSHLIEYLLENHQKGLATYFMSSYPLEELRAYYSKFTYPEIEVEKGEYTKGILGFYDVNILSSYISTLYKQEKIDEFFAAAPLWFTPDLKQEDILALHYINAQDRLNSLSISMNNQGICILEELYISTKEVELIAEDRVIDFTQIEELHLIEKEKFVDTVFEEFEEEGFDFQFTLGEKKEKIYTFMDEAKELGIVTDGGLYRYILLRLLKKIFVSYLQTAKDEYQRIAIMDEILKRSEEKR